MPQYLYSAMDGNGREQKGKINADSEEAAAIELKSKGLFPTSIKPAVLTAKRPRTAPARRRAAVR